MLGCGSRVQVVGTLEEKAGHTCGRPGLHSSSAACGPVARETCEGIRVRVAIDRDCPGLTDSCHSPDLSSELCLGNKQRIKSVPFR